MSAGDTVIYGCAAHHLGFRWLGLNTTVSHSRAAKSLRLRRPRVPIALLVAGLLAVASVGNADGSTVSRSLVARIGAGGVNGSATLRILTNGKGRVYTSGRGLAHRRLYRQAIYRGTCTGHGSAIVTLSSTMTNGRGTASHTARLTTVQVARVRAALRGGGRISIRIGTGRLARCGTFGSGAQGSGGVPSFSHVYVIVMENHEYSSIVGSSSAPYLNGLIAQYGLATNYDAVSHPSEPNYLALFSGSTQGVTDDGTYNLAGTNLADQVAAHQRTWRVFAQNVPLGCYTGASASGGPDGSGSYARKHEPAISFTDISGNAARCANIVNFSQFDPAAANYELIVPNLCNDMHDCSVATGDSFLKGFVPSILASPAFRTGGVLFITWDEGTTNLGGGGHVATLVIGPGVRAGFKSAVAHDHYSLVRTIEDAWGLGCLNQACSANDLREFFH